MKIESPLMRGDFDETNDNQATRKMGIKSAFFYLQKRSVLPIRSIQVGPPFDAWMSEHPLLRNGLHKPC